MIINSKLQKSVRYQAQSSRDLILIGRVDKPTFRAILVPTKMQIEKNLFHAKYVKIKIDKNETTLCWRSFLSNCNSAISPCAIFHQIPPIGCIIIKTKPFPLVKKMHLAKRIECQCSAS